MRLEEAILLKSFEGTQSHKNYYKDLIALSAATSPPSANHRVSSYKDSNRYVLTSTSSSPESMSISSPERRHSSEESDSEIECNSLLIGHGTYIDNACGQNIPYNSKERFRNQDTQWDKFNQWSSDTREDYPLDHGYHSMEPLDFVPSTKYGQSHGYSNANVKTAIVNDKYRHCIQPQGRGVNNRVRKLLSLPINNNQTTDSYPDYLWHDSAWSAPQKSRSFNSCVNPFEEFLEVNKRIKSSSRSQKSYGDGIKGRRIKSQEWYVDEMDHDNALDYPYVKEKVDYESASFSAWKTALGHHHIGDKYGTFADESRITLDHLDRTLKEDDAIWKTLKIEYQPESDKWFKADGADGQQLQTIGQYPEDENEQFDDKLSPSSNSSANESMSQCSASSPPSTIPKVSMMSYINNGEQQSKLLQYDSAVSLTSSGDIDVNMVSRSFNNFSVSSNKQRDILKLLQEKRKIVEANICENQARNETKILNTGRNVARTASGVRRRRVFRKPFVTWNGAYPDIADGLVLEKVRYDPNWRRHNSALCSADDTGKNITVPVSNPLSVPSQQTKFEDHVAEVQTKSLPLLPPEVLNIDKPDDSKESPIENTTPSTNSDDLNRKVIEFQTNNNQSSKQTNSIESSKQTNSNESSKQTNNNESSKQTNSNESSKQTNNNENSKQTDSNESSKQTNSNESSKQTNSNESSKQTNIKESSHSSGSNEVVEKKISSAVSNLFGDFDVYDIESTMPTIDWAAMEANLIRAAEEDHWSARRRNDREEIRRRLALGPDADEYYYYCNGERLTKKPSLTTRLQSGMNLQICFMNETASDSDGLNSDGEGQSMYSSADDSETKSLIPRSTSPNNNSMRSLSTPDSDRTSPPISPTDSSQSSQASISKRQRPSFFFAKQKSWRLRSRHKHEDAIEESEKNAVKEVEDFFTRQARLHAEARLALSQAKEMARMQMQIERQKSKKSPISDIVGLTFPENGRYTIRHHTLTTMNIAQLQVIVNDLHTQIEILNEDLVSLLLKRDDLHMEQDSMLVDIEDLTRYLGAKETGDHPLHKKGFSLK